MSRFKNFSEDTLNSAVSTNRWLAENARKQGNYSQARIWEHEAAQAEKELAKRSGDYSSSGIKNVGAGAAIGAFVAGPVGAVVGGIAGLAKTIDNKKK